MSVSKIFHSIRRVFLRNTWRIVIPGIAVFWAGVIPAYGTGHLPFRIPLTEVDDFCLSGTVQDYRAAETLVNDIAIVACRINGQYSYASVTLGYASADQRWQKTEAWVGTTYRAVACQTSRDGQSQVQVSSLYGSMSDLFGCTYQAVEMVISDAQSIQKQIVSDKTVVTTDTAGRYVCETKIDVPGTGPIDVKYVITCNNDRHVAEIRCEKKYPGTQQWQLMNTYRYSYRGGLSVPCVIESVLTLGSQSYVNQRMNIEEFVAGQDAHKVSYRPELLTTGTDVEDKRVLPALTYVTESAALLSDEEISALAAQRKREQNAMDKSNAAANALSFASNDPHNIKDVSVTGESWGNRLRRVPNWAYGGAAVLFLGGWIVAASRRKRK